MIKKSLRAYITIDEAVASHTLEANRFGLSKKEGVAAAIQPLQGIFLFLLRGAEGKHHCVPVCPGELSPFCRMYRHAAILVFYVQFSKQRLPLFQSFLSSDESC